MVWYDNFVALRTGTAVRRLSISQERGDVTVAKCELCGKGPQFGHNVSHSNVRTKRMWRPNVQKATVVINGVERTMKLCTKCLKTLSKSKE